MRWRAYAAALPKRERAKGAKRMTYWPNSSAKPERLAYRVILTPEAEADLRPIATFAGMRLAQPASGSNTLARVSRVSPTIPNAARWRVRAFHLTKPYGNCCLELVTGERTGFSSQ